MPVFHLKLEPWDKTLKYKTKKNLKFKIGDEVVIKFESNIDLAKIIEIKENDEEIKEKVVIIRKATEQDLEKKKNKEKKKKEILNRAEEIVKKSTLPMKLIDAHLSLDGGKIVFAFIAPERLDFRNLVKDLSKEFCKSIRLHQINPREEVKFFSSFGPCGRIVCCFSFLKNLGGISTDFIKDQSLTSRGVERVSGICGRLKCCLAFEREIYLEESKKFPPLGAKVKTKDKEGEVVGWHILKESIDLKIDDDTILEVPLSEIKKIYDK
jgi:cell fate regulator YaaT (PSP1 superfamily)